MFGFGKRNKRGHELIATIESLALSSHSASRLCAEALEEAEPGISSCNEIQLELEITGFKSAQTLLLNLNNKVLMKDYILLLATKMVSKYQERPEYNKGIMEKAVVLLEEGYSKTDPQSMGPYIYLGIGLISSNSRSSLDIDQTIRVESLVKTYLGMIGLDKLVIGVSKFNDA